MRLVQFPFFLDQSIHRLVGPSMSEKGLDVVTARELGLATAPDDAILQAAAREQRVLFTHDVGFGRRALESSQLTAGVVVFRQAHRGLETVLDQINELLTSDLEVTIPFLAIVQSTVAGGTAVRLRGL